MKQISVLVCVVIFLASLTLAQTNVNDIADKRVVAVADDVLTVIVSQPDCPLKIEEAVVVRLANNRYTFLYKVKNQGSKAIKNYSIARWYSDNTGFLGGGAQKPDDTDIHPNEEGGSFLFLSPKEKEMLDNSLMKKPLKDHKFIKIGFVMIGEILFSDGTRYSDLDKFNSFTKHLELFGFPYSKFNEPNKINYPAAS